MAKRNTINDAASVAIRSSSKKGFDLDSFKKSKNLSEIKENVNFVITYRFVGSLISLITFFLIIKLFKSLNTF